MTEQKENQVEIQQQEQREKVIKPWEILKELSGVTTEHALSEMVAIFNLPAGLSLKLVQAVVKSGA